MKPAPFAYHAPERVDEALALLADDDREARVLAGGQSLVPMMNFRLAVPDALVDLRRIEGLRYVRGGAGGELEVGAGARQSQLLREPLVAEGWPLLAEGVRHVGHPQIRSRGTVCGSLVHHDPTAELPALAVALDATLTAASVDGERRIAAADFFTSYYEVALEPGEMVVQASFPPLAPAIGWAFEEVARRRGDFALVGSASLLERGADDRVASARLVLFGVGERPLRATGAEEALRGSDAGEATLAEVAAHVAAEVSPVDDGHATATYRREAAAHLAARTAAAAWGRCARG